MADCVLVDNIVGELSLTQKEKKKPFFLSLIAKLLFLRIFSKPLSGNNTCHGGSGLIIFFSLSGSFLCIVQFLLVEGYV